MTCFPLECTSEIGSGILICGDGDAHRLARGVSQRPLTDYDIAQLAFAVEWKDLGIQRGLQDEYPPTLGGFNSIEFEADRVIFNPLRIPADVIHELEHNVLLCYTGRTRASDRTTDDQTTRWKGSDEEALAGLRMGKDLAVAMKNALFQRRLSDFGVSLRTLAAAEKTPPRVRMSFVDTADEEARKHGALGGKVGCERGRLHVVLLPVSAKAPGGRRARCDGLRGD